MMVAVRDNSATNVLIDRVGVENANAMLDSLGLEHVRLRRKMMDLEAASQGRENISTPREMMQLLEAIYRGKALNRESTAEFFKLLSTNKDFWIPRRLPGRGEDRQQAGFARRCTQRFRDRLWGRTSVCDLCDDGILSE
jgi:beta-lactamase class A